MFDLDGTLVDTAPDLHAHLNRLLAEHGRPALSLERVRPMIGNGMRHLIHLGMEETGGLPARTELDGLFEEYLRHYTARPHHLGAIYDGVEDILQGLAEAGVKRGVCTNKPQEPAERLLAALALDRHFTVVIGGDHLPARKPDPIHLGTVLERLAADRARSVLVGDSATDVEAAAALGMPCVLVSFGYTATPARELGATLVIDSMRELPAALIQIDSA
ncbi:MAG: phosphoglycolate phosphatase [Pseudomonadota bacterium]